MIRSITHHLSNVVEAVMCLQYACVAARGTGSLVFDDNVTVEGSNRMNSEVYTAIQCVLKFSQILQISVQPKHTVKAN